MAAGGSSMKTFALTSMLALVVLGAGCGGSGGSTVPAKSPAQTPASMMVAFRIVLPTTASNARRRLPRYVSASTHSAAITAAPGGGSAGAPVIVNCTTVCTGQIAAAVGSDTFTVTLYDAQNAVGNLLSTGTLTQTIVQNQANSVNVTLDGVVASLTVALNPAAVTEGTAATVAVTVNALDADGNTIVGPGIYANASGSPLTVALVDSDGSGATHLSLSSLTAPTSGITLSYNGATIPSPTITASAAGATPGHAPLTVNGGTGTVMHFSGGGIGEPYTITAGPDGALWFTDIGFESAVGRITTAGAITEYSAGIAQQPARPLGIAAGPDGALWFTEYNNDRIGRSTTSGTITEFSTGITAGSTPQIIVAGPDGALWFTEGGTGKIGRITTTGTVSEYPGGPANSEVFGIAVGSDNNLWFTEFAAGVICRITTGGTVTQFPLASSGSGPRGIAPGPDGALWFTEVYANQIGRITTSGTITEFSAGITAGAGPEDIAAGPDGNLWFTERQIPQGQHVGRITTLGTITEFPTGGISATEGIAAGSDGGMWFTEPGAAEIGRIQP